MSAEQLPATKRFAAQKGLRKRPRAADASSEDEGAVDHTALKDIREEQKLRVKAVGVDASRLLPSEGAPRVVQPITQITSTGDEITVGLKIMKSAFASGFAKETAVDDPSDNPRMRAFIESRMRETQGDGSGGGSGKASKREEGATAGEAARRGGSSTGTGTGTGVGTGDRAADAKWLYEMPEAYKPIARGVKTDADVGAGGVIMGGTGITEVALPEDVILANAREIERFHTATGVPRGETMGISRYATGSLTANYDLHRKEYGMNRRGGATDLPDDLQRSASGAVTGSRASKA